MPRTISHPTPPASSLASLFLLLAAFFTAVTPYATAQFDDITLATIASTDQIQQWLRSGDPRRIAWGAHFAREQNDQPALALIAQMLTGWRAPQASQDQALPNRPTFEQQAPTVAMLDALIQRNRALPTDAIATLAPFFPAQAALLAKNLSATDATPLLLSWYAHRSSDDRGSLAHVAAIILSHSPPPAFAATVLAESEETLYISVFSKPDGLGFGSGGSFIGSGVPLPPPAWPPVFNYVLTEDFQQTPQTKPAKADECQPPAPPPPRSLDPIFADAAGDHIRYHRYDLLKYPSVSGGVSALNDKNRHYLLAQMLGVTDDQIPWNPTTFTSIVWHSDGQYLTEAAGFAAAEEAKLRASVQAIESHGLLTPEEAASVRPKLSITIQDLREPSGPPLPQLTFADLRTTLSH
ncbi:MAG TPA: hypothetical protein VGU46_07465 [Acidobacteriaceae bacterium]|nr:hypothetical protein [Acidobacteriaceae bacterium]